MSPITLLGVLCCLICGACLYGLSPNQLLWRRSPPGRIVGLVAIGTLAGGSAALCVSHSTATALLMTLSGLMVCGTLLPLGCALMRGGRGA